MICRILWAHTKGTSASTDDMDNTSGIALWCRHIRGPHSTQISDTDTRGQDTGYMIQISNTYTMQQFCTYKHRRQKTFLYCVQLSFLWNAQVSSLTEMGNTFEFNVFWAFCRHFLNKSDSQPIDMSKKCCSSICAINLPCQGLVQFHSRINMLQSHVHKPCEYCMGGLYLGWVQGMVQKRNVF